MEEAVFTRLAALQRRRKELEELASTPANLDILGKSDLEELRRMARPPLPVCQCLEVVYMTLHYQQVRADIERLPQDGRLNIRWSIVQKMLARFDTFFPAMENYDIAGLMSIPGVARYIARAYFGEGGLTQDRVYRSSVACASLFSWCSRSLARVEAALELLRVKEEILSLTPSTSEMWRCETDDGWVNYPPHIHEQLQAAASKGGIVHCELNGMSYEINLATRTQKNTGLGSLRPIRPPTAQLAIDSMQGAWHTDWGADIVVRGTKIWIDGEVVAPELETLPDGTVRWVFLGEWRVIGGSPLAVFWGRGTSVDKEVTWVAVACRLEAELGSEGPCNDEGAPVKLSPSPKLAENFYCGRRLGRGAIPGSDGRCGPTNGPQCASCKRYQYSKSICFDSKNCTPTVTVSPDGLSASWADDDWGAVAVRARDGSSPAVVRLRCTSIKEKGDVSIGVADKRVSDFITQDRPHGERGGWLIRGCLEEKGGTVSRTQFNLWSDGTCCFVPSKVQPTYSEEFLDFEGHWTENSLEWFEDTGDGLVAQCRIRVPCAKELYCWAFPGATVEITGGRASLPSAPNSVNVEKNTIFLLG